MIYMVEYNLHLSAEVGQKHITLHETINLTVLLALIEFNMRVFHNDAAIFYDKFQLIKTRNTWNENVLDSWRSTVVQIL